MHVNANGKIIDGVDHCYAFGRVNDETIFSVNDFSCPSFSNTDELPYVGGQGSGGTIRIRRFEWIEDSMPLSPAYMMSTTTAATTVETTTIGKEFIADQNKHFL